MLAAFVATLHDAKAVRRYLRWERQRRREAEAELVAAKRSSTAQPPAQACSLPAQACSLQAVQPRAARALSAGIGCVPSCSCLDPRIRNAAPAFLPVWVVQGHRQALQLARRQAKTYWAWSGARAHTRAMRTATRCRRTASAGGAPRGAPRTPARRLSCSAWTGVHTARSQQVWVHWCAHHTAEVCCQRVRPGLELDAQPNALNPTTRSCPVQAKHAAHCAR